MATEERTQEQTPPAPDKAEPRRRFDFYTLLPELEVVIPDEKDERPVKKPPRPATPPPKASGGYILQAGSFRKLNEADSMKAKLAMLGVEANIQTVKVNRDTWHRVRIGPYSNLTQLQRVRDRLRKNSVDTLLMKGKN